MDKKWQISTSVVSPSLLVLPSTKDKDTELDCKIWIAPPPFYFHIFPSMCDWICLVPFLTLHVPPYVI
jgi:hypothetical protein